MGMEKTLKKTIFGLGILSLALFTIGEVLFNTVFSGWYFWFFPFLILFFILVNSGFFVFFHKSLKKSPANFIRSFMATTGAKLVIYMILILSYILTSPKTAVPFAVTLSVVYIAYTAYDLYVMLTLLKRKKEINTLPNQFSN
jgi:hypothetical protein